MSTDNAANVLSKVLGDHHNAILKNVDAQFAKLSTETLAQYHELATMIGTLRAMINDLARGLGGEKRKPKIVGIADAPIESDSPVQTGATPSDAPAVAAGVPEVKKPRPNKMTWARGNFQKDAEFKKWVLAEITKVNKPFVDSLAVNPALAKKTGAQKASAEATLVWKLISDKKAAAYKPLMDAIDAKFAADKSASEKTEIADQQVTDEHTDDE